MGKYLDIYCMNGNIPDVFFNNKDIEELLLCSPVFQSSYGSSLLCGEEEGDFGLVDYYVVQRLCLNFCMQNNLKK